MRVFVSLAACLCAGTVTLANSPQNCVCIPVVVVDQAAVTNPSTSPQQAAIQTAAAAAKQSTAASKQTTVSISKQQPAVAKQPATAAQPVTRAQGTRRLTTQLSPEPLTPEPAPVQVAPRSYQRSYQPSYPGNPYRMRIDSSRFPRFKSWTEM